MRRLLPVVLLWTEPKLVELVVERLETDSQNFSRSCLVVARVRQRHHDQAALGFFDCRAGGQGDLWLVRARRLARQRRRQMARLDERASRRLSRARSRCAARGRCPASVLLEHAHRLLVDAGNRLLVPLR